MPRRFVLTALGLGSLLVLSSACADRPVAPSPCSDVTVRVSAGIQPSFTWTPACQIEALVVHLPGPGAVIWGTMSHNLRNSIMPPVRYGVFPDSAAMTANILLPLVAGKRYEVTLFRLEDGPSGSPRAMGVATFTP